MRARNRAPGPAHATAADVCVGWWGRGVARAGISLGWGWSRDEAVNAYDNHIVGNWVNGSNWLLVDGGSIYVLGPQPRSTMQ